jgi:hypothetical protein
MGVEHAPDIDVIVVLNVDHEVWIALQHAAAQPGQGKLTCVARRSGGGMIDDGAVRGVQRLNKA